MSVRQVVLFRALRSPDARPRLNASSATKIYVAAAFLHFVAVTIRLTAWAVEKAEKLNSLGPRSITITVHAVMRLRQL